MLSIITCLRVHPADQQSEQCAVRVWPAPLPAAAVPLDGRVFGQLLVPGHLPPHAQLQVRALRAGLGAGGGRQGSPEPAAGACIPAGAPSSCCLSTSATMCSLVTRHSLTADWAGRGSPGHGSPEVCIIFTHLVPLLHTGAAGAAVGQLRCAQLRHERARQVWRHHDRPCELLNSHSCSSFLTMLMSCCQC